MLVIVLLGLHKFLHKEVLKGRAVSESRRLCKINSRPNSAKCPLHGVSVVYFMCLAMITNLVLNYQSF